MGDARGAGEYTAWDAYGAVTTTGAEFDDWPRPKITVLQFNVDNNYNSVGLNHSASGLGAGTSRVTTLFTSDPYLTVGSNQTSFLLTLAHTLTFGAGDCDLGCDISLSGQLQTSVETVRAASATSDFGNTAHFGLSTTGSVTLDPGAVFLSDAPQSTVPEPATVFLTALGLAGVLTVRRRASR